MAAITDIHRVKTLRFRFQRRAWYAYIFHNQLMKRLLLCVALLAGAFSPVFAHDDGGDPTYIPDYQQLVREGYGPRHDDRYEAYRLGFAMRPMPTQAYYLNGSTLFYGYKAVPERIGVANALYAFGYPADFYHHLMPVAVPNLDRIVVALHESRFEAVAKAQPPHTNTISTVQSTTPAKAAALSPIGEKSAH